MKRTSYILALFLSLLVSLGQLPAQTAPVPSLSGVVTDPSGALVPGALVQVRGPGGEQRNTTDGSGQYSFPSLRPGKYLVRVIVKGFAVTEKQDLVIHAPSGGHYIAQAERHFDVVDRDVTLRIHFDGAVDK